MLSVGLAVVASGVGVLFGGRFAIWALRGSPVWSRRVTNHLSRGPSAGSKRFACLPTLTYVPELLDQTLETG